MPVLRQAWDTAGLAAPLLSIPWLAVSRQSDNLEQGLGTEDSPSPLHASLLACLHAEQTRAFMSLAVAPGS